MQHIISFEIAALITFAISLFLYTQRNNLPVSQNLIFLVFNIVGFIATAADLWTAFLDISTVKIKAYYWFVQCLSYVTLHFIPPIFANYIMETVNFYGDKTEKQRKILHILTGLPYIFELILIFLSPVLSKYTTLVFTIDDNFTYIRGTTFFYFVYICTVFYILLAIFVLIYKRKSISKFKILFIWLFVSLILCSVAFQFLFPAYLVQCYGISLGSILLCCFVQNQEDFNDGSTSVFNLNSFVLFTSKIFKRKHSFTCICVVINDTQFITNTYGVNRLNICLNQVGKFLLKDIKNGICFYMGQSVFCIIVRNKFKSQINNIINKIQDKFKDPWNFDNITYKLHQTICIIDCPMDAGSTDDIIAITSLIFDKLSYKTQIIYAKDLNLEQKKRTTYIENTLRNSLEENRISIFYQPIFSTKTQKIIGAEAILNLADNNNHFISSEEFLPIAEKNNVLSPLGAFSVNTISQTMSNIRPSAYGISSINMNLSSAQCKQENLAAQILLTCKKYHIPENLINLEITETAVSKSSESLHKNLQYLSEKGISLTLDNFGTGFSNLDYLLSLPFKFVKIDKSLITSAYSDLQSNEALSSIIKMIHGMGMEVIADGITSSEQVDWLSNSGCDYLQGDYFSKPLQIEEFLSLMAKVTQNSKKEWKKRYQQA